MRDDLISRQAAIAEFSCCELTPDGGIDANYAIDFLKQLPSAQPDKRLEKIADLVEGTIDHFDRDDAIDLLYQIKEVLNER